MKFQSGDVAYWVERRRHSPYEYYVNYGIVDEEFSDAVCVDRLHIRDNRYINDIPYKEFPSVTKWQKLPKGWTYNTELFEMEWRNNDWAVLNTLRIDNPEDIKKALELGILVYLKDYDQTIPHSEVSNKLGWRVRKEHDNSSYIYPYVTLQKDNAFKTYEEAQAVIDAQEAEWKRQSELTDEEWSKEEIERDLERARVSHNFSVEDCDKIRDFLFGMDHIDSIETRIYCGEFQWKYEKNKRWNSIDIDNI